MFVLASKAGCIREGSQEMRMSAVYTHTHNAHADAAVIAFARESRQLAGRRNAQ